MYYDKLDSQIEIIYIKASEHLLEAISFEPFDLVIKPNAITNMAKIQLSEYFKEERKEFDLPLNIEGTSFELAVYQAMLKIAYGQTKSYGDLARASGHDKAYRAVGSVCGKNKFPIIVPCHRVLKADGQLGHYAFGSDIKAKLLELESH